MSGAPNEKPKATVSISALIAYCLLTGATCAALGAWIPTWTILQVTEIQNSSAGQRWEAAQRIRKSTMEDASEARDAAVKASSDVARMAASCGVK